MTNKQEIVLFDYSGKQINFEEIENARIFKNINRARKIIDKLISLGKIDEKYKLENITMIAKNEDVLNKYEQELFSSIPLKKHKKVYTKSSNGNPPTVIAKEKIEDNNKKLLNIILNDTNFENRRQAINRISKKYLPKFINDIDNDVRKIVAKRIDVEYLPKIVNDRSRYVRKIAAENINKHLLYKFYNDDELLIRLIARWRTGFFHFIFWVIISLIMLPFKFVYRKLFKKINSVNKLRVQDNYKDKYLEEAEKEIEEFLKQDNVANYSK